MTEKIETAPWIELIQIVIQKASQEVMLLTKSRISIGKIKKPTSEEFKENVMKTSLKFANDEKRKLDPKKGTAFFKAYKIVMNNLRQGYQRDLERIIEEHYDKLENI